MVSMPENTVSCPICRASKESVKSVEQHISASTDLAHEGEHGPDYRDEIEAGSEPAESGSEPEPDEPDEQGGLPMPDGDGPVEVESPPVEEPGVEPEEPEEPEPVEADSEPVEEPGEEPGEEEAEGRMEPVEDAGSGGAAGWVLLGLVLLALRVFAEGGNDGEVGPAGV